MIQILEWSKENHTGYIPMYPDPIYRPSPKPAEIPLQNILRELTDLTADINMDFKEILLIKKV